MYKLIRHVDTGKDPVVFELGIARKELFWGIFDSAKNHKRQSVTAKREMSRTPKVVEVRLGQARLG